MKNFNFLSNRKIAFIITAVVLLVGIVAAVVSGFNFGVDFTGGSKITLQLKENASDSALDEIKAIVKAEIGEDNFVSAIRSTANNKTVIVTIKSVKSFDNTVKEKLAELYGVDASSLSKSTATDDDKEYAYFTFKSDKNVAEADLSAALNALTDDAEDEVFKKLSVSDGTVTISYYSTSVEEQLVSQINEKYAVDNEDVSTISKNRAAAQTKTALIAAAVAIVLMFVYIAYRFKQFSSAASSVICLFFNLYVMFTFYALFGWELTLDIIPACLTILGYSINATIVIFDRIRENYSKDKSHFDTAANDGVHSTLFRSLNTTITTLITIVLVYILGVESIKAFALPLIIGILAGLFSSVFLSAPLWSAMHSSKKDKKAEAN